MKILVGFVLVIGLLLWFIGVPIALIVFLTS